LHSRGPRIGKAICYTEGQAAALLRSQSVTQLGRRYVALAHENG